MTIVKRGSTYFDNSGGVWASYGFTKHTGTAAGDFVIVVSSFWENNQTITPSCSGTGWTFTQLGNYAISGTGNAENRVVIWYAVIGGSENSTFTVGNVGTVYGTALYLTLYGEGALSYATSTFSAGTPVTGATSFSAPSQSTTAGQGLVVVAAEANGRAIAQTGGATLTTGIEGAEAGTANGGGIYFRTAAGGTEGAFTLSLSQADAAQAFSFLINDAGVGASVAISSTTSGGTFDHGEKITISGTGFSASGNTVKISPTDNVDDANAVTQVIYSESETSIGIWAVRGNLTEGVTKYLFVINDADASNATGYQVTFNASTGIKLTVREGVTDISNIQMTWVT